MVSDPTGQFSRNRQVARTFFRVWPRALAALLFSATPTATAGAGSHLILDHVNVIDATGEPSNADRTVVISDGRIAAIGPFGQVEVSLHAERIDARGKYLIPGLWDAHVHLSLIGVWALPLHIANGVLGVRDMGGNLEELKAWRGLIEQGRMVGPRILTAGPILESARFMELIDLAEDILGRTIVDPATRVRITRANDASRTVDSLKRLGVDFIKFRSTPSADAFHAMAKAAREAGLSLVGHAPLVVGVREASAAGQRSFEHGFSPPLDDLSPDDRGAVWTDLALNESASCPTLISTRTYRLMPDTAVAAVIADSLAVIDFRRRYTSAALLDFWTVQNELKRLESPQDWPAIAQSGYRNLAEMSRAGVRILAGTDLGAPLVFPGFSLHDELALMVREAGLTPMEALQCATRNVTEFLGLEDSLGTVEVGKIADLVLLDANPLEDIDNIRRIQAVILGGRLFSRHALDQLLDRGADMATEDSR